jgi:hypothetical protein
MQKDYHLIMAGRSKEQLLAVLRERYDYEPEAVMAAQAELKRRGVNGFDIAAAEDEAEGRAIAVQQLAETPLTQRERMLWLCLPFLALTPWGPLRLDRYGRQGQRRKVLQAMEYVLIGFSAYVLGAFLVYRWI